MVAENLLLLLILLLFVVVIYLLAEVKTLKAGFVERSKDIRTVSESFNHVSENLKQLKERAELSQRLFSEAFTELRTKLDEVRRTAEAARELKEMLRAPKSKGALGETSLYSLVADFLPRSSYAFQYRFKNGTVVDLVIRVGDRLLPVDSKFPAEKYASYSGEQDEEIKKQLSAELKRAMKKHVDEIAQKYIRQDEVTFDFALMFIPSEGLYYEVTCSEDFADLNDYFKRSNVFPVSPNTLYIYLSAVTNVLKQLELEKNLEEVVGRLKQMEQIAEKLHRELVTFNNHLKNAHGSSERVNRIFNELYTHIRQLLEIGRDE